MMTFLKKIWTKITKSFKDFILIDEEDEEESSTNQQEEIDIPDKPKEYDTKKLLNAFYKHPELIQKLSYEKLYSSTFNMLGQMLDTLDNQWRQNEIDYALGYVNMKTYCEKRISMQEMLQNYKNLYLAEMNLA